jgi:hypothetical protein
MITSDSSALSDTGKARGGSQESLRRKTLETSNRYFMRSRSNKVNSRKTAQTGREIGPRKLSRDKRLSDKSVDRKNKSVTSKKKSVRNVSFDTKKHTKKKPPAAMTTIQPKMRTLESQKMKSIEPKKMRTIQ